MPLSARPYSRWRCLGLLALLPATAAAAPEAERPTIEHRYAAKALTPYAHLTGLLHLRNDLYETQGVGADLGFWLVEEWGVELRGAWLNTHLSRAARRVKRATGLVPDARPQQLALLGGARWSPAYGKVLLADRFVVHFDPQLFAHGGVTLAETRVLPTLLVGAGFLAHFKWGIEAKLDLALSIQLERRDRGWVGSLGFFPVLGLGWTPPFLAQRESAP
jgi:outer membrane beta-barrel protein